MSLPPPQLEPKYRPNPLDELRFGARIRLLRAAAAYNYVDLCAASERLRETIRRVRAQNREGAAPAPANDSGR